MISKRTELPAIPKLGRRFDQCLHAQDPATLNDPGFRVLIEDLQHVKAYRKTTWSINKPYVTGAVNILVPHWNEEFWPTEACGGLPREPADCVTAPRENYIICNPAVGREIGSPLVQSGIASVEEEFGTHFILLTLIGHELGHIQLHSDSDTHHLIRFRGKDGMKCFKRDNAGPPTEEEKADEIGLSIACEAIRSRPDRQYLAKDAGGVVSVIDRLENRLDEGYFAMDDLCTGDKDYPSISRRKQHFADRYFACLYPGAFDSVRLLNQGLSDDLNDLEQVLLSRQITGQVGSGNYGRRALTSNSIVATGVPDTYLSYDSTDNDSGLWAIFPDEKGLLQFRQLLAWDRTGRLVASSVEPDESRALLLQVSDENEQSGPSAVGVIARCSGGKCTATENRALLPQGVRLFPGEGGIIALVSRSGFRVVQPDQNGFRNLTKAPLREHDLDTAPDDLVVGLQGERGIVLIARRSGGLYNAAVYDNRHVEWKVLLTLPHTTGMLEAATIVKGRLLISFYETPQIESTESSSLKMWDCPADPILDAKESQVQCISYTAPEQVSIPVALVTHDLSSISDDSIEAPVECQGKLVIHHGGWLWFLDRTGNLSDLLPANGLVGCDESTNVVTTFRARRVDQFKLRMVPSNKSSVSLATMNASGPPKKSGPHATRSMPSDIYFDYSH